MIAESSFKLDSAPQSDGRVGVTEVHRALDGVVHTYNYLSDGSLDPQTVLQERATLLNSTLAARAAAKAYVLANTEVMYTKHEFLDRFTAAERIAVRETAKTNPYVADFMEMLSASGGVYMSLARPGIAYLQSLGKLTTERAAIIGAN